jgi:hypothetical protein
LIICLTLFSISSIFLSFKIFTLFLIYKIINYPNKMCCIECELYLCEKAWKNDSIGQNKRWINLKRWTENNLSLKRMNVKGKNFIRLSPTIYIIWRNKARKLNKNSISSWKTVKHAKMTIKKVYKQGKDIFEETMICKNAYIMEHLEEHLKSY